MAPSVTLWVGQTPPSFNAVGYTGSRWALTKAVKEWKATFEGLLMVERAPKGASHVRAEVVLTFPIARGRDEENYRVIVSKALADALKNYGVIPDDTAEFFTLTRVRLEVEPGVERTDVTLDITPA